MVWAFDFIFILNGKLVKNLEIYTKPDTEIYEKLRVRKNLIISLSMEIHGSANIVTKIKIL